jgi:polar amino acid transport system substrate-binding protein
MKIHKSAAAACAAAGLLALTACSSESPSVSAGPATSAGGAAVVDQAAAACSSVAQKYPGLKGKTINVGSNPGLNYYDYVDEANPSKVVGLEPDLVGAVSKCLGFTVNYQKMDFNGLIPALTSNRIDLITSGMYATPERAKQVNFVSYMKAAEAAVVRKGNPKKITSLDTLCGTSVAQITGTVEVEIAAKQDAKCKAEGKPGIKFSNYTNNTQLTQSLGQGRADVFLTDAGVAAYIAKQFPTLEKGFDLVTDFQFGIGVNKKNQELLNGVADSMKALHEKGQVAAIAQKWGFSKEQVVAPAAVTG